MNKIKSFLNSAGKEFIYGGHLTALGASSIAFTSALLLDIPITWDFLLIVYLITYTVYLYNRFKEFDEDFLTNPDRTQHIGGYIKYTPLIVFCSTLVIIWLLLCFGNSLSLAFGLSLLLSGFFYSLFFKKVTRKIVGFKNFYVSFIWAFLIILMGTYYDMSLNLALILLFLFVFLRILVNNIFFDIKDIGLDKKRRLKTFPVVLGKDKALNYLQVLNFVSFIPLVSGIWSDLFPFFALWLIFFYFYSLYYLKKVKKKKSNAYFLFTLADGEYLLWATIIIFY